MKSLMTLVLAGLLLAPGCKKDKKEDKEAATKPAETKPAETTPPPTEVKPAEPVATVPELKLEGTAAENMMAVYQAGVDAIKSAKPADAGASLIAIMAKYNVADVRAKAKEAKAAGKGATKEQIEAFKALEADFKKRAEELGKEDAAAFSKAAEAWAAAWS